MSKLFACLLIMIIANGEGAQIWAAPYSLEASSQQDHAITAQDPLSVDNVKVDATAKEANKARAKALQEGQRRALEIVMQRLKQPSSKSSHLSDSAIEDLVANFEVKREKHSNTRYLASIAFHFKKTAIEALTGTKIPSTVTLESTPQRGDYLVPHELYSSTPTPPQPTTAVNQTFWLHVSLKNLQDWVSTESLLKSLKITYTLKRFAATQAVLEINYPGGAEALQHFILPHHLDLSPYNDPAAVSEGSHWVLIR